MVLIFVRIELRKWSNSAISSNSGNISILTNLTFLELKLNNDYEWVFDKTVAGPVMHRLPAKPIACYRALAMSIKNT